MKQPVMIKAANNGISVVLDCDTPFRDLAISVCEKFSDSRDFLGAAKVSLSFEGRELSADEVNKLIACIESNSDLYITYYIDGDTLNKRRTLGLEERITAEEIAQEATIVLGPVFDGTKIEADKSLVVIGDVKAGATVTARGNIIVTGNIYGNAWAGYPANKQAYIYAGAFCTDICSIGDISGAISTGEKPKKSLFSKKEASFGIAIALWDGELISEPVEAGILKRLKEG